MNLKFNGLDVKVLKALSKPRKLIQLKRVFTLKKTQSFSWRLNFFFLN